MRLSYGQWLRRERRDKDARPHLNATAHVFRLLAATPWLTAATHEQRAAGVRSGSSPADEGRFSMRATDGFCGEGYTAFRPHPAVRRPELP
jgi:hypothetical protein